MAPGKTAPRLLQDLLTYDPRHEQRAGRNLLTSAPPQFDATKQRAAAIPFRNCRHTLLQKAEQSQAFSPGHEPDRDTVYKIAAYCSGCRWHFDVTVDFQGDGSSSRPCRSGDQEYMLHHFLFDGSDNDANSTEGLGGNLTPRTYSFHCSAPPCPVKVQICLKPPHFSDADVATLTNQAQLRRRWEAAKQTAGERADVHMARGCDGPDYLSTYLNDALNPTKGKARIPLLNKKFLKTFGTDCDHILKRLGFKSELEQEENEVAQVWYLPKPEEAADDTLRATLNDARYELNVILLAFPHNERIGVRHQPMYPPPATDLIERAIGCTDYLKVKGRTETRAANREEDHPYYASLGALGDFADELILFSFSRQTAVDSENAAYYYECLQDLAIGRKSEFLEMQVAMLGSQGLTSRREVEAAYRSFGIEPAHAMHINDEHIVGVFKSRLSDVSPSMADETRRQLRIIGEARNSDVIKSEAAGAIETYEQALSWLDLTHDQADDFIPTMFTLKTQDNPTCIETARKAVSLIAEHRHSERLRQFLREGTMDAPEMDIGEAYALFSVIDRTAKVDFDVMKTMVAFASADSAEKMQKAYEMIEQDQAQNLNNRSNQSEVRRNNYPLETWPVGLRNIGNTCYLNSVLQFLFTIKPLRELVLDCDAYLQDPSPEALKGKKVGRTAVTAERVEVAQKFVHELRTFFEYMITAPTDTVQPAIDLAALALCKTDTPQTAPQSPKLSAQNGSGLGSLEGLPVVGPMLPPPNTDDASSTTAQDSIMDDARSDTSMQAMDLQDHSQEIETAPTDQPLQPTRPPPIPPRPAPQANQGKSKLGNIEESARQQDAAEVLSNIFDLFSCAIRGDSVLREDEQQDTIKKLFFSDVTSVRNVQPKPEETKELRDHFLVSPGWRDRNLYATLDDDFGLSEMEGGITKFDYIDQAAPIQIINLRRLQYDRIKGEQVYDRSHIGLETTLYLDRYLGKTQSLPQLELLKLREAQWEKQRQLRLFDERRGQLRKTEFEGQELPDIVKETGTFLQDLAKQYQQHDDNVLPTPPPELVDALQAKADQLKKELAEIDAHMTQLETDVDRVFQDAHDHPYKLHAVFTHRGGTKGGHYWIYIYDFQSGMWRKYNDDQVTLADEKDIFERESANIPPASTGVVYIRADLVEELTEAVKRVPAVEEPSGLPNGTHPTQMSDIPMQDADDDRPPPLEPIKYDVQVINGVEKE